MDKEKLRFRLEIVALFSALVVVVVSATELGDGVSRANLIGLVAGSFGAGAAMASAVRRFGERRMKRKRKETA